MPLVQYQEVRKAKVEADIMRRFRKEIEEAQQLGFSNLIFTRELNFPFSALLLFWVYPMMVQSGETVTVEWPFRFVLWQPLLFNYEYDSYCRISPLGIRFYTRFIDGTVIISSNHEESLEKAERRFYRYGSQHMPIAQLWEGHLESIMRIETKGRETETPATLEAFSEIAELHTQIMLKP